MQELVTEKIATQVVVERDFGGPILGPDHFLAYGVVEMFVGVNLAEMKVTKVGENFIVDLPASHIFHTSLDETTLRVFRNATTLQRLDDLDAPAMNSEIRLALLAAGEQFANDRNMIPSREEVIDRVRKTFEAAGIDDAHILFTAPGS